MLLQGEGFFLELIIGIFSRLFLEPGLDFFFGAVNDFFVWVRTFARIPCSVKVNNNQCHPKGSVHLAGCLIETTDLFSEQRMMRFADLTNCFQANKLFDFYS